MKRVALAVGLAVLSPAALHGQAAPLEGAWRVDQVVTTGPGAGTIDSPQPGLLLFSGRYYSYVLVTGDEPRPPIPRGAATAEDLLDAWNPFSANAGTFEVSGDAMTRRPLVAKSPDAMAPGAFNAYTFRLSADTLWVTTAGTETGPTRYPSTVRYVRVR
jgi:hypothetical protein